MSTSPNPVPTPAPLTAVTDMTDREIAEETLTWLRTFGQAMQTLQSGGMGAMLKGMVGMGRAR